jgi:hypothetical protein
MEVKHSDGTNVNPLISLFMWDVAPLSTIIGVTRLCFRSPDTSLVASKHV